LPGHRQILGYGPNVEAAYLTILVITFLAIAATSAYFLRRLFAGRR
jgi:hypothetical protein